MLAKIQFGSILSLPLFSNVYINFKASLVAQFLKNLPVMPETQVCFLGGQDPLEKKMATHSSILAWETPWTEQPGGLVHGIIQLRYD